MAYKLIKADNAQDAVQRFGNALGHYRKITGIKASSAGKDSNGQQYYVDFDYDDRLYFESDLDLSFRSFFKRVQNMNSVMKVGCPDKCVDLGANRLIEFRRIILEEIEEVNEIIDDAKEGTPVDIGGYADWLGDIIVYCTSEAVRWGIPIEAVLDAIMKSQASKLDANGQPIHKDGKFVKGPNYVAPDDEIDAIIEKAKLGLSTVVKEDPWYKQTTDHPAADDGVFPKSGEDNA